MISRESMFSRRSVLKGLLAGGAAVTVPLPRLSTALAGNGDRFRDGSPLPTKFGVWFFGNGIDPATWHPSGSGGTQDGWQLSPQLSPLAAYKSYLTVLSNFTLATGGAHVGGAAGIMTGANTDDRGAAQLPSIDQVVAQLVGQGTPYRSLEVGLSKATPAGAEPVLHAISHSGPSAPNYPEFDPHRLFARLFGVSAASPALRQAKKSVLDAVLADFRGLQQRVGSTDRQRLEAHAEGIRALERRLDMPTTQCEATAPPASIQADDREEAPAALHDVMSQMIAMALACDLTHVFSYTFTLPAGHVYYRHLGEDFNRSFHEDIMHLVDALPNGYQMVTQGVQYAMQSLAVSLQYLQAIPGASGGTLLDDMCLFCTSEVASGWDHGMTQFPLLFIGKARGRLPGNMHYVAPQARNASETLLTAANIMGAGLTTYGKDEAQVSGNGVTEICA